MWYLTTNKILITRDVIWLQWMYFQPKDNKVKTTKVAKRSKVGKGNEILVNLDDEEVLHLLEVEQAEENINTNNEQEVQEPNFMVEPAADPAQLLNDLEEMEIIFKSEDEEVSEYDGLEPENVMQEEEPTVRRSNRTPAKPNWMNDYDVGKIVIQDITMSENIVNNQELHEMLLESQLVPSLHSCIVP